MPHSFRVVSNLVLRILGMHASPKRIASYKDGRATDARGYQVSMPEPFPLCFVREARCELYGYGAGMRGR